MMYNKNIEDCFFSPNHSDVIDLDQPYSSHYRSAQSGKNVVIDLYMLCSVDKAVLKACFKAVGNPYLIAGLEWLCRRIEGLNLTQLLPSYYEQIITDLEIPAHQYPIAVLIDTTYKELLKLAYEQFKG